MIISNHSHDRMTDADPFLGSHLKRWVPINRTLQRRGCCAVINVNIVSRSKYIENSWFAVFWLVCYGLLYLYGASNRYDISHDSTRTPAGTGSITNYFQCIYSSEKCYLHKAMMKHLIFYQIIHIQPPDLKTNQCLPEHGSPSTNVRVYCIHV